MRRKSKNKKKRRIRRSGNRRKSRRKKEKIEMIGRKRYFRNEISENISKKRKKKRKKKMKVEKKYSSICKEPVTSLILAIVLCTAGCSRQFLRHQEFELVLLVERIRPVSPY